jgi:hypothetical protein
MLETRLRKWILTSMVLTFVVRKIRKAYLKERKRKILPEKIKRTTTTTRSIPMLSSLRDTENHRHHRRSMYHQDNYCTSSWPQTRQPSPNERARALQCHKISVHHQRKTISNFYFKTMCDCLLHHTLFFWQKPRGTSQKYPLFGI